MQVQAVEQVGDPAEPMFRIFEGDPADETVDLVAVIEQEFGEVTAVLPGDAGDQRPLHGRFCRSWSCGESNPGAGNRGRRLEAPPPGAHPCFPGTRGAASDLW